MIDYVVATWRCPHCRYRWQTLAYWQEQRVVGPEFCPKCWIGAHTCLEKSQAGFLPDGCLLPYDERKARL